MIILSLAACGMKGSLELPAGPAPEPLLGGKPGLPAKKPGPADGSTDTASPNP
jgi:hypothetical protein